MREVYLTPEHIKWWLLSPGVTIYYDKLKLCKSDFEEAQKESGNIAEITVSMFCMKYILNKSFKGYSLNFVKDES